MSAAATALRDFCAPLLPGWVLQFGRWVDDQAAGTRYGVIKPAGGARAELVRRPQFTLTLIGSGEADIGATSDAADALVQAMRADSGSLVFLQPAEPVYMPTSDGRPVFEIAVSAIIT
jgi:hypothetical protein